MVVVVVVIETNQDAYVGGHIVDFGLLLLCRSLTIAHVLVPRRAVIRLYNNTSLRRR